MPELPLDHPKARAALKDVLLHPRFGAFLDDYSDDPLVGTVYEKLIELAFPGLTKEQVRRLREYYVKREPVQVKKKPRMVVV